MRVAVVDDEMRCQEEIKTLLEAFHRENCVVEDRFIVQWEQMVELKYRQ